LKKKETAWATWPTLSLILQQGSFFGEREKWMGLIHFWPKTLHVVTPFIKVKIMPEILLLIRAVLFIGVGSVTDSGVGSKLTMLLNINGFFAGAE
jgi:hypothetical protein